MITTRPTETIILMGGPCSGQTTEVYAGTTVVTVYGADGVPYAYVRTEVTSDDDPASSYRVYRRRGPED